MEPSQRIGRARHTSSLYDYVKVRVWLGDRADPGCHSHVLSRFLIARTLMATQVQFSTAVKVALEVKKHLVDSDQLDVTQAQLEAAIFKFMRRRSLPEDCIFQYKLLSAFHQRRQALIVLIAGGVLCHKSTIASQLAQRMNLGNVLNVDCVARLVLPQDAGAGSDRTSQSSLASRYASMGDDVAGARDMWVADCDHVFKGVNNDLAKCLHDGKTIVACGFHLNLHALRQNIGALAEEMGRENRHPPIVLSFFVTATDRELVCAVTSTKEDQRQIEFSDALVQPFSKSDEETIAVEASQATLPALLSQMHAHVLKSIRESMDEDG